MARPVKSRSLSLDVCTRMGMVQVVSSFSASFAQLVDGIVFGIPIPADLSYLHRRLLNHGKVILVRTTTDRFSTKYDISRPRRGIPIERSHSQTPGLGHMKCNTKDITCYWLGISRHCCSVQLKWWLWTISLSLFAVFWSQLLQNIDSLKLFHFLVLSWAAFRYFRWCFR